ncbi:hypothetical protein QR680_004078 [Steinernema hermaphroditum]|uniref:Uncharacterized protein n=1 Tax=Steinernema hermaphroditum TaxID=289476 RepID=A0AA39HP08_9BILA|nr:hypothetical protein QR680_004078 [Steinernema hermaphroditum]
MCDDSDKCLFGRIHVVTGTLIISIFTIGLHGLTMALSFYQPPTTVKYESEDANEVVLDHARGMDLAAVIGGVLAFIALRMETSKLLLPLMIKMAISVIGTALDSIAPLFGIHIPQMIYYFQGTKLFFIKEYAASAETAIVTAGVVLEALLFRAVYRCYVYLKSLPCNARDVPVQMQNI